MSIFLTIIILAIVAWKGYYAWKRGIATYRRDCRDHDSLREYLLGNGASPRQARQPFVVHALQRAGRPLLAQWRLLVVLAVLIVLLVISLSVG